MKQQAKREREREREKEMERRERVRTLVNPKSLRAIQTRARPKLSAAPLHETSRLLREIPKV